MEKALKYVDVAALNRALGRLEGMAIAGPDNLLAVLDGTISEIDGAITSIRDNDNEDK